jgi:hypothetical protein
MFERDSRVVLIRQSSLSNQGENLLTESKIAELFERILQPASHVVVLIATYPRGGETGALEEQGALIEAIANKAVEGQFGATGYRLLWTECAILFENTEIDTVVRFMRDSFAKVTNPHVEVRAIIVADNVTRRRLDEALEELSSRRNFNANGGGGLVRMIDGRIVNGNCSGTDIKRIVKV